MKIVHISSSDTGGAANSCLRLHLSLLEAGLDSKLLTISKKKNIPAHSTYNHTIKPGIFKRIMYRLGFDQPLYKKHQASLLNKVEGFEHFSFTGSEIDLYNCPLLQEADIINLHWVAGFLDYKSFFKAIKKPIVWTFHDMNAFTGGCHYSDGCEKYKVNCDTCPQLAGTKDPHLSRQQWKVKSDCYSGADLTIVTPSKWLANCTSDSTLLRHRNVHIIPYSLNLDVFKPMSKEEARKKLGLPLDKKLVLFVSTSIENKRKGLDVLLESISLLDKKEEYLICSAGQTNVSNEGSGVHSLGEIKEEEKMMLAYNAADVFVLPSKEDNLPNVVLESIACGVPVIGFNIGGMPDMICSGFNGSLSHEVSAASLAKTIGQFFLEKEKYNSALIRKDAEERYNNKRQAEKYISVYKSLIK